MRKIGVHPRQARPQCAGGRAVASTVVAPRDPLVRPKPWILLLVGGGANLREQFVGRIVVDGGPHEDVGR
jgi:hypothetical protein